jgi:hypothetical protein
VVRLTRWLKETRGKETEMEYPFKFPKDATMADTMYERLHVHISKVEAELGEDQAIELYHYLPDGEPLRVRDVGYHNPYLMKFYGVDANGNECDVLVHFGSTHLLLRKVRAEPGKEHPIGFSGG